MSPNSLLEAALSRRRHSGLLRSLTVPPIDSCDFSSNDYLSLARNECIHAHVMQQLQSSHLLGGSTGSRLLSGNSKTAVELEDYLATYHNAKSALLFNSGYDANVGLFETLPHPGCAVLYDELVHASVHDGLRRSRPGVVRLAWKHNNIQHLEELVWKQIERIETSVSGDADLMPGILIVVEAIYSMDGDKAPLVEIVNLTDRVGMRAGGVHLIVDEAHSTGVCGSGGRGLVAELGLEDRVFVRLHTFGKGVGAHGAVVLGPSVVREYLINYARPLIYSTSLPAHSLITIQCAYHYLEMEANQLQKQLTQTISHFRSALKSLPNDIHAIDSQTAIQGIIVPGNKRVSKVCEYLRESGYDVRPIRSPTVPKGSERLRVCLHIHNSKHEINGLIREIGIACRNTGEELSKL
ncbi:putative 8-amino-7-oxononanoate synthase [Obelidium mucronatum]|nr:putative 8-amino-7-oxononanoate synthase [Obelidium mucronatum]